MNYLYIALAILVAAAIGLVLYVLWRSVALSKGKYGKIRVGRLLRQYAITRNFKVLENITMTDGKKPHNVHFVLVGFFGLLFVTVLQGKGEFYGDYKEAKWFFTDESRKVSFNNPVAESRENIEVFRRTLARQKIYNLPIEAAVVVVNPGKKSALYLTNVTQEITVSNLKEFKKHLNSVKFEKDNNLDTDNLVSVIKEMK